MSISSRIRKVSKARIECRDIEAIVCAPSVPGLERSCEVVLDGSTYHTCTSLGAAHLRHLADLGTRGLLVLWVTSVENNSQPFTSLYARDVLREIGRKCAVILIVDLPEHERLKHCRDFLQAGAYDVILKDQLNFFDRLRSAVKQVRKRYQNGNDGGLLVAMFNQHGLIGASPSFVGALRAAHQASRSIAPVLITGETGTGKQRVAEAIHRESDRRKQPCRTVNCGALQPTLIESELFGHVRGAYTGANCDREGAFISAGSGTLILDEITELPYYVQCKLLRVLQERLVAPVGADGEKRVECRIIALTNVPDTRLRGFHKPDAPLRKDLYYRLNALSIRMPPLRHRLNDIPMLVEYFLQRHQRATDETLGFEPLALELLKTCPWPGNIRQLENIVQEMLARKSDEQSVFLLKDVPIWLWQPRVKRPHAVSKKYTSR